MKKMILALTVLAATSTAFAEGDGDNWYQGQTALQGGAHDGSAAMQFSTSDIEPGHIEGALSANKGVPAKSACRGNRTSPTPVYSWTGSGFKYVGVKCLEQSSTTGGNGGAGN